MHMLQLEGAPAAWHSMASELQRHLHLRFAFPHPGEAGCLWVVGRVIKPVDPVVVVPALHPLSCEVGLLLDAVCVGFCACVSPHSVVPAEALWTGKAEPCPDRCLSL